MKIRDICEKKLEIFFCEVIHACKLQKFIKNIVNTYIQTIIFLKALVQKKCNRQILKILNYFMYRLF